MSSGELSIEPSLFETPFFVGPFFTVFLRVSASLCTRESLSPFFLSGLAPFDTDSLSGLFPVLRVGLCAGFFRDRLVLA